MRIKNVCKKLIICIMVFLVLFNFITSSVGKIEIVYADTTSDTEETNTIQEETENSLGGVLNGIAGVLTWIPRALIIGVSALLQLESYFVIDTAGHGSNTVSAFVTPFDIFFNKFTLTDINIFSTEGLDSDGLVYKIRESAAMWYYVIRVVVIAILLIMLLIIGIRMALATLAEEKAKVRILFTNWVVSVGLVMLMSMIVVLVIQINEQVVGIIERVAQGAEISDMIDSLRSAAFSDNFILGWGATITYLLLAVQTTIFVIVYIKRFLVVTFLVIISPIMPITYSLDKAKGGQARALNMWFKEFAYNVFIQVIHCLIYVVMIAVPLSGLSGATVSTSSELATSIMLILSLLFIKKAEELLKAIFGFDKSTTLTTYSSVVNNAQNAVLTGISVANGTYTVTNNLSNNTTTFGSNIQTLGQRASNTLHTYRDKASNYLDGILQKDEDSDGRSFSRDKDDDDDVIDADYREVNDEDSNDSNNEQTPIMLPAAEEDESEFEDKIADAIESTKHDETDEHNEENEHNEEDEKNQENEKNEEDEKNVEKIHTEEIETEEEDEEKDGENKTDKEKADDKENQEREQLKELYNKLLDEIRNTTDLQKQIQTKLQDLESKLGKEKADELRNHIEELFSKERESAVAYVQSLGDTIEGQFAALQLEYLESKKNVNDLTRKDSTEDESVLSLVDEGIENGAISSEEGMKLLDNAVKVANGEEDETQEILGDKQEEKGKKENVEIEGEVVDVTKDLGLSKKTINSVLGSTRRATMENSRLLEMIDGDITVEGDFSQKSMLQFNTRILEKAKAGAYSEDNFRKAEEKVRREGDIAVKRLDKFKAEQSEANARMLTSAGKKYATLMVEAQQAGLFIASAGMSERSNVQESRSVQTSTINQRMVNPSPKTDNVIGDLNEKRKRA